MNQTHIDHTNYPKGLKRKSFAELQFIIKDAGEAKEAYPQGHKAGYYADEIHYCHAEIKRRQR